MIDDWDDRIASLAGTLMASAQAAFPDLSSAADISTAFQRMHDRRQKRSAHAEHAARRGSDTAEVCAGLAERAEVNVDAGSAREAVDLAQDALAGDRLPLDERIRLMLAAGAAHRFLLNATGYVAAGEQGVELTNEAALLALDALEGARLKKMAYRRLVTAASVLNAEILLDLGELSPVPRHRKRAQDMLTVADSVAAVASLPLGRKGYVRRDHDEQDWWHRHAVAGARSSFLAWTMGTSPEVAEGERDHLAFSTYAWATSREFSETHVESALLLGEVRLRVLRAEPTPENLLAALYALHAAAADLTLGSFQFFRFLAAYAVLFCFLEGVGPSALLGMVADVCRPLEDDAPLFVHRVVTYQANREESQKGWSSAVTDFEDALRIRETVAGLQAQPAHRTIIQSINDGIPAWLARAHVKAGDIESAVEALERGRATSLTYPVRLQHAIDGLRGAGHGQLADELDDAHRTVLRAGYTAERLRLTDGISTLPDDLLPAVAAQRRLVAQARVATGDPAFPRPLPFATIARAARDCPLVYVLPSTSEGNLIIVSDEKATAVDLPGFTRDEVYRRAADYLQAYLEDPVTWSERAVPEVGAWLWETAMSPLLDALHGHQVARLVPCGALVVLPLHAAWRWTGEGADRRPLFALDLIDVSYLPAASVLCRPAHRREERGDVLVVSDPAPTSQAPLDSDRELRSLVTRHASRLTRVTGVGATRDRVLEELSRCSTAHFSVHGTCDIDNSLLSCLHLANDERLSVAHIRELGLQDVELVVLSACESALSVSRTTDEITTLPMAFLETGARCVVGSMWEVDVSATAELFAAFYERWSPHHSPLEVAADLCSAQRALRDDEQFGHPWLWAAFTAIG